MDKLYSSLFDSAAGSEIYSKALSAIEEYDMEERIKSGVLVGLSGGADSVMLLLFLLEYRSRNFDFPIIAMHINHLIRGDAAFYDEDFSRHLCSELGVEFLSRRIDVPALSSAEGLSLEECARNVRYREFADIISGREDISSIAVAHNSDDNLETVILNIFRGTGTRGAAGIPPVRDNIIRPLIYVKKCDILACLDEAGVGYVTDATNAECEYKRNRVRHNIVPELNKICNDPAAMAARLSRNLRLDDEYIDIQADRFLVDNRTVFAKVLNREHKAVKARVIIKMAKLAGAEISAAAIDAVCELLCKEHFSYSLPGGTVFLCERGVCRVLTEVSENYCYNLDVKRGKNSFPEYDSDFFVTEDKLDVFSLNVYKISIQADLSSAIINGSLYLRPKCDGDTVYYGGITRKLKKLYSDLKIPVSHRDSIPVLCDDSGVVWVPGFGVRDDGVKGQNKLYAALGIGCGAHLNEKRFRCASEYR